MTNVKPSMCLKVKGDTFFLPDTNGSVYFRNNVGSFRMEGDMIDQWIEKLIPMFNGEYTLEELTDGLPDDYREQIYEIAGNLYKNGFVRDVSEDRPAQLPKEILKKYASQIEFLDNFGGSGAHRFQHYRQQKVLAVGAGPFFVSLVASLLESGLPKFDILLTDSAQTNQLRLHQLIAHALSTDQEVAVKELSLKNLEVDTWRDVIHPFDSILYVSASGNVEELRLLHSLCRESGKVFLPAMFIQQVGIAGPLVQPDSNRCFESAWRRIHQSALENDPNLHSFSTTAGAMLANLLVFELFKHVTGVTTSEQHQQFYLLNLETMEGNWYPFMPHPLVLEPSKSKWVSDLTTLLARDTQNDEKTDLIPFLTTITSAESGILHTWDEGELKQLPLAQCRVQAVDPLSEGPAKLLPSVVCSALTHEEARREAGLTGLEMYVARMVSLLVAVEQQESVGIGTGETVAEGVCRGLQKWLSAELQKQIANERQVTFSKIELNEVEDPRCLFYLKSLTEIEGEPTIGLCDLAGFPVVWVRGDERWIGSVALNITLALRNTLQQALHKDQAETQFFTRTLESVQLEQVEQHNFVIPKCEGVAGLEELRSALQVLKQHRKQLLVAELELESFFKEDLAGVFAVLVREEETK